MTRQHLGQHFLSDPDYREQIARAIRVSPHSLAPWSSPAGNFVWIEVGAGHGEMTEHLLQSGAPVIAVELDAPLVNRLQRLARKQPLLSVVSGDILETDLAALAAGRRMRVYGNLPYYITSPILHHFFSFAALIDEIHIVIQREVAERLAARPGTADYGYLSVVTQFFARPELALEIPRSAFEPPPEVGSALVSMLLPGECAHVDIPKVTSFLKFVKTCFAQKRKTLPNNLRALAAPARTREILQGLQLREDARAEQLSIAQFAQLFRALVPSA